MNSRPCVTVVVVTYQSSTEIQGCLCSLFETSGAWISDCRIVDNDSSDNTVDVVIRQFPQVKIFRNTANLGYSKAVNLGAQGVESEYLLVLNPDTQLTEHSLGE